MSKVEVFSDFLSSKIYHKISENNQLQKACIHTTMSGLIKVSFDLKTSQQGAFEDDFLKTKSLTVGFNEFVKGGFETWYCLGLLPNIGLMQSTKNKGIKPNIIFFEMYE